MKNFKINKQPEKVVFCKLCVYSNQKVVPSTIKNDKKDHSNRNFLRFNKDGVCSACELILRKKNLIKKIISIGKKEKMN